MTHLQLRRGLAALSVSLLIAIVGSSTSPAAASAPDPYVEPVLTRMPTFSAVVMTGSTVHHDGTKRDTGIRDVATYVNLRGRLLVATTDGRLVSWRNGHTHRVARFKVEEGVRIVTDRTSRYAAIVRGTCYDGRQHVRVYDRRADKIVLEGFPTMSDCSGLTVDSGALYYPRGDQLVRLGLDDGEEQLIDVDPDDVSDVVADHLLMFEPGGAYVRPIDDLSSGGRLSLAADYLSPNLHWSAALEQGLTIDNTTRKPVSPAMRVPKWKKWRVDVHGWVGPDTIAYDAARRGGKRVAVYECDATQSSCEKVINAPTRHLVQPGGWYPFVD